MGIYSNSENDKDYTESQVDKTINNRFASPKDIALVNDFLNNPVISPIGSLFDLSSISNVFNGSKFPFNDDVGELINGITRGFGGADEKLTTGLKAYPTPSVKLYQKCVDKDGLSVWDDKGWWRCLFPRSTLDGEHVLSKEDVLEDKPNKFGLFFREYTGYLDWKSQMKQLIRQKDEEQKLARYRDNNDSIYNDYQKDLSYGDNAEDVISSSKSVYFKTLPNGDGEEITEISNVYKDGKSENKKFKRLIPREGPAQIEDLSDDKSDSKLSTWIWGNEKK